MIKLSGHGDVYFVGTTQQLRNEALSPMKLDGGNSL